MRIIIAGGGIMGLSAAWALRLAGHEPVLYEQGPIPNPLGSSVDRHRLIRFPYGDMTGYARMVVDAYAAWERLWLDLGTVHYHETGTLVVARADDSWVRDSLECLDAMGVPAERLAPARIAEFLPLLDLEGARWALFTPTGGLLFADRILRDLARHLRAQGVAVHEQTPIAAIDAESAQVRLESGAVDRGDALVVAAGPWTAQLLPAMRERITPSRQVLVYLEPPAEHLPVWRAAPTLLDQIEAARGGFYAIPPTGGAGLKIGDHGFTMRGHPSHEREPTPDDVQRTLGLARTRLFEFERYRLAEAKTCFYSVSAGERFIVEPLGARSWVLAGFSGHGFKFGALIGLRLAETLTGARDPQALTAWAAGEG